MKARRQRDWAERAAERIVETRVMDRTAALKVIAAALRRAEKRGYQRGVKDMAKVLTGTARQRVRARERDRSEG